MRCAYVQYIHTSGYCHFYLHTCLVIVRDSICVEFAHRYPAGIIRFSLIKSSQVAHFCLHRVAHIKLILSKSVVRLKCDKITDRQSQQGYLQIYDFGSG